MTDLEKCGLRALNPVTGEIQNCPSDAHLRVILEILGSGVTVDYFTCGMHAEVAHLRTLARLRGDEAK